MPACCWPAELPGTGTSHESLHGRDPAQARATAARRKPDDRLTGTAAGLAIAPLVGKSLAAILLGGQLETHIDTSLDIRVFGFAALAAMVAALLVGLIPASQATAGNLSEQIKQGQHTTQAHERQRVLPRIMMAAEVALALMLVVGAGLLASSLVRLYRSGAGFDPNGIQNIALSMDQQPLKGDALMQFYHQLGEGLRQQPGVTNVSFAGIIPFTHYVWDENFSAVAGKEYDIHQNGVSPGYFETMRIPLFRGRDFHWTDATATGLKIILTSQRRSCSSPAATLLAISSSSMRAILPPALSTKSSASSATPSTRISAPHHRRPRISL